MMLTTSDMKFAPTSIISKMLWFDCWIQSITMICTKWQKCIKISFSSCQFWIRYICQSTPPSNLELAIVSCMHFIVSGASSTLSHDFLNYSSKPQLWVHFFNSIPQNIIYCTTYSQTNKTLLNYDSWIRIKLDRVFFDKRAWPYADLEFETQEGTWKSAW